MSDDDQKQLNTEEPEDQATDQDSNPSDPSTPPEDSATNLPVEEAGQLEAPDSSESENSTVIPSDSEESQDLNADQPTESEESNVDEAESKTEDQPESEETTPEEPTEAEESEPTSDSSDSVTEGDTTPPTPLQEDTPGRWYVVHTYSGHENKVATTLKQRVESEHLTDKIFDVLVPTQDKIEIRSGKKTEVKEKIFPGYILVKMLLDDQSWLAVRTTQGVTSFVGMGNKPTPISEEEVRTIIKFTQIQEPTFKQIFSVNDTVKIIDGPFAEFIGKIDSVDEEKGKVRVLVSIFGRETPVELDFLQVQKI